MGMAGLSTALQREAERSNTGVAIEVTGVSPVLETFDEVYSNAGIKSSGRNYTILKIADMVNSKHLAEMTLEAKRNALMMALEAAGAEIGDLLQDAVTRNRALDDYEEARQEEVRKFEAAKAEENNKLHAELERLTNEYMSRIQANSDEVAEEQDTLRGWQKRKQMESQRITDAATFCVPQGNGSNVTSNSLGAVLERVNISRR
jgi:type I site-specific restriction endonuclease